MRITFSCKTGQPIRTDYIYYQFWEFLKISSLLKIPHLTPFRNSWSNLYTQFLVYNRSCIIQLRWTKTRRTMLKCRKLFCNGFSGKFPFLSYVFRNRWKLKRFRTKCGWVLECEGSVGPYQSKKIGLNLKCANTHRRKCLTEPKGLV